mgnify:CR=1 FL=1
MAGGTIESVVQMPNLHCAISGIVNQISVKAPRVADRGAVFTMVIGIQNAILALANNGGGVVKLVGDEFGMIDWDLWGSPIEMRSGVIVDGINKAVVTSSATAPAPIDRLLRVEDFADSTGATQNNEELYDAGKDFKAYCGLLSLVEIRSGVDAGWYRIREFSESIPGYGYDTMTLINRDGTDVTPFADAGGLDYTVHIYRAGLRNMIVDASYLDSAAMRTAIHMYHANKCFFENIDFRHNGVGGVYIQSAILGYDVNDCKCKNCVVNGRFQRGCWLVKTRDLIDWNNENNRFFNNDIDLSDMSAVLLVSVTGITIESNGAGIGYLSDNKIIIDDDVNSVEVDVPDGYLDRAFAAVYTETVPGGGSYASGGPHPIAFKDITNPGCFDNTNGEIDVTGNWTFTARRQMRLRVSAYLRDTSLKVWLQDHYVRISAVVGAIEYILDEWRSDNDDATFDQRVIVGGTAIVDLVAGDVLTFEITLLSPGNFITNPQMVWSRCSIEELKKEF